jgi:hypothetical protein
LDFAKPVVKSYGFGNMRRTTFLLSLAVLLLLPANASAQIQIGAVREVVNKSLIRLRRRLKR